MAGRYCAGVPEMIECVPLLWAAWLRDAGQARQETAADVV